MDRSFQRHRTGVTSKGNGDGRRRRQDDKLRVSPAVRELIISAAEVASHKEAEWLDLAKQIRDEESGFVKAFRRLSRARPDRSADEPAGPAAVQALEALSAACRTAREATKLSATRIDDPATRGIEP